MKHINDLTIKEYEEFKLLLDEKKIDLSSIFRLFGITENFDEMSIEDMRKYERDIFSMELTPTKINKVYKIGNRKFKATLNLTNFSAGQFVDYQTYLNPLSIEGILSVILLPQYKKFGIIDKVHSYNSGYDIFEVKDYLYENFKISDAMGLSNFFFQQSIDLLKVTQAYLNKKLTMKKLKQLKKQMQD